MKNNREKKEKHFGVWQLWSSIKNSSKFTVRAKCHSLLPTETRQSLTSAPCAPAGTGGKNTLMCSGTYTRRVLATLADSRRRTYIQTQHRGGDERADEFLLLTVSFTYKSLVCIYIYIYIKLWIHRCVFCRLGGEGEMALRGKVVCGISANTKFRLQHQ